MTRVKLKTARNTHFLSILFDYFVVDN